MIRQIVSIISVELRIIARNGGVMLILLFAPLIYAVVYSSAYAKQVVEDVPIAVIDNSQSTSSRKVIAMLNASPYLDVKFQTANMLSAEKLLHNREIYGMVYIPEQYELDIISGRQSVVSVYCDASYFLMYREIFQGFTSVISTINQINTPPQAVLCSSHTLFNPQLGYGTFIMPAILIVILQQTAVIGIGMVGAIWRRRRLFENYKVLPIIVAKIIVYGAIYAVIAGYILTIHYHIFDYPSAGTIATAFAVMVPYILAVILLGIFISTLFRRAETVVVALLWSSIPILLLSGASIPLEGFPQWLHSLGLIFPSSSAVAAYIRVESMGATISQVRVEILRLWLLVLIYTILAALAIKKRMSGRTTKPRTSNLLPLDKQA